LTKIQMPPLGEPLRLSTNNLPDRDRLPIWLDFYGRKLFNLDIEPLGDAPFRADVTLRALPGVTLTSGSRTDAHYRIRKHHLQNATDMIVFMAVLSGRSVSVQRGREATILPGQGVVMLSSEAADQILTDGGRYVGVYVPRPALTPAVRDLGRWLARPIGAETEALWLLTDYVRLLQSGRALANPDVQRSAAAHIGDLLVALMRATGDVAELARRRGVRAARLATVEADIAANLHQPGLRAEDVARRQRITPGYVRKLFRQQGTSFSDHVVEQRLSRIYQALNDPGLSARPISAIALDAGFADVSYFNRSFRRRFGATPSDVRARKH
jgi:AraC-like DNA-binding protein